MKTITKKFIKNSARSILNKYCKLRLKFRKKPYKIILILAHTRSGSTLMQHILLSNPHIAGYGESHKSYDKLEDFENLICNTLWRLRKLKMTETYLVDKIVHHRSFRVSDQVIRSERVFTILFIRNPQDSILSMSQNCKDELQNSSEYYIEMLYRLEQYARMIPNKNHGFFLTYEQLLNQTTLALSKLQQFLKLEVPLDEKYDLFPTTGKSIYGDWSAIIKSGTIMRRRRKNSMEIPSKLIAPALAAYHHCCETIPKYCTSINSQ